MTKYITINGKIRHAHGPVGQRPSLDEVHTRFNITEEGSVQDMQCCPGGCGYAVCSKTGPCAPKPKRVDWRWRSEYQKHLARLDYPNQILSFDLISPEDVKKLLG